ncbi:MAG TPA: hypothetical protein VMT12_02645 [Syntrophales bacterium]|nr:hypothetical protein [Syntrophales bacterium]
MKKLVITAILVGFILGCATPPAMIERTENKSPQIMTDKSIYVQGEKVQVRFSGSSGHRGDWISLSKTSSPDNQAGDYNHILEGLTEGTMTFESPSPGTYEARGYFNYSRNGYLVYARCKFEVVDGNKGSGQEIQKQIPVSQEKSEKADLTKLEKAYTRLICNDFKSILEIAESYPEEIKIMQTSMLESLKAKGGFEIVALSRTDQEKGGGGLLVVVNVKGMNIIGFWQRGFIHNIGRRSWIELNLKLIDQATQKVLREQQITSENNPVAAFFSFGSNDRSLPSDMGKLLAEYIALVVPQK